MTRLRLSVMCVVVVAGCLKKINPYYCADHPDNNCTEDAGVHCTDSTQCPPMTPVCDLPATICVQCTATQDAACTGVTPICRADEQCHGCELHGECGSNVCLPSGACAVSDDVAYVSSSNGADNMLCTMGAPCTRILSALGTGRPYLKLQGTLDELVIINDRSVIILSDPGATLTSSSGGNIITITGTSNVQIYDLAIKNAAGGSGVYATGMAQSLTLGRVSMSGNNGGGGAIVEFGGTLTVNRSKIFDNPGGGLSIMMAPFDIQNNFITGNGIPGMGAYGGIFLAQTNTGSRILSFNTIADNKGPSSSPTGVSCNGLSADIVASNNIIYGNSIGPQVGGAHCPWAFSDIGPDGVSGDTNVNMDPRFVASGDYHLQASSPVINRADPTAMQSLDIDGDPRPLDTRSDIGADEYRRRFASGDTPDANPIRDSALGSKP